MNLRPNMILSAILVVALSAAWVMAQDNYRPVPAFPAEQAVFNSQQQPPTTLRRLPEVEQSPSSIVAANPVHAYYEAPPGAMGLEVAAQFAEELPSEIPPQRVGSYSGDVAVDRYPGRSPTDSSDIKVGVDLYSAPDFKGGLIVRGRNVAMKLGGYVKADFIYDFNAIDSTDSFNTTTIPVGARHRTNARFHARQTRLSFDTRWLSGAPDIRVFVEGDFFSADNQFRLRHAYGEAGSLLVGQTWTTFTDVAAAPATLDFEGSVSSVNRRQAQARWTMPLYNEDLTLALAVEDTRFIIQLPENVDAETRSPSPDFVGHLRLERDWAEFQVAGLYRIGGAQAEDSPVITGSAWGLNFTGVVLLTQCTKTYYQIVFGDGIGSYRELPDAAPSGSESMSSLPLFGWMVGVTHDWNKQLSSNFTYAENSLENTDFQKQDDVHRTTYLAANLIWSPRERVSIGMEYLYGIRQNFDLATGAAHRLQTSFIFDLP